MDANRPATDLILPRIAERDVVGFVVNSQSMDELAPKRACLIGRRQFVLFTAAILWLSGIAYGAQLWMAHDHNPGVIAPLARQWPTASQLMPDQRHGTLDVPDRS